MAETKTTYNTSKDIRKLITSKKLIIGSDRALKLLKLNKLSRILLSSGCSKKIKSEIKHLANLQKLEIEDLRYNNEELGTICKKPFPISVLSILKE
jgi:large subunit ribosomal protein L30e